MTALTSIGEHTDMSGNQIGDLIMFITQNGMKLPLRRRQKAAPMLLFLPRSVPQKAKYWCRRTLLLRRRLPRRWWMLGRGESGLWLSWTRASGGRNILRLKRRMRRTC
ncbi:MAG: hypothetical protein WCG19_03965 [Chlorobiaceae bacterium]